MNEEDVVYLYNGTLHSHKKEWNHAICSNMDGPRDYHTKWSKPQGERQIHMISLICVTLKNDANKTIYKKKTDPWT